jgi:ABC-type glycerol-3-phosphate transport system substrate-binding protein
MNTKPTLTALGLSLSLLLAACGDSPQDAAAPPPQANAAEVPATALSTATAYSQFAASLAKTETGQPLEVNGVTPPTSETADPIPVL